MQKLLSPIPRFYEDEFHEDKFGKVFLHLPVSPLAKMGKRGVLLVVAMLRQDSPLDQINKISVFFDLFNECFSYILSRQQK